MVSAFVLFISVFLFSLDTTSACTGKVKLLVPLYVWPGAAWDTVAAGASSVSTVAIINPNSGPVNPPDSSYLTYMQKLHNAGVILIGYVHTSYGTRSISVVENEIAIYAVHYPNLSGIFLDEASPDSSHVSYYASLYKNITSKSGWTYSIVNPGIVPTSDYVAASSQIVAFEDPGSKVASSTVPNYASCSNEFHFAAIAHSVPSSQMKSIVDTLYSKNYLGYLYVTDGAAGCCTYNTLASYYSSLVEYIASK